MISISNSGPTLSVPNLDSEYKLFRHSLLENNVEEIIRTVSGTRLFVGCLTRGNCRRHLVRQDARIRHDGRSAVLGKRGGGGEHIKQADE